MLSLSLSVSVSLCLSLSVSLSLSFSLLLSRYTKVGTPLVPFSFLSYIWETIKLFLFIFTLLFIYVIFVAHWLSSKVMVLYSEIGALLYQLWQTMLVVVHINVYTNTLLGLVWWGSLCQLSKIRSYSSGAPSRKLSIVSCLGDPTFLGWIR